MAASSGGELASSSLRQLDAVMADVSGGAKRVRKDEMEVPDQKRFSDVEVSVDSTETHAMMEGLSVALDLPLESFSADLHITERADVERMKSGALATTYDVYLCESGFT